MLCVLGVSWLKPIKGQSDVRDGEQNSNKYDVCQTTSTYPEKFAINCTGKNCDNWFAINCKFNGDNFPALPSGVQDFLIHSLSESTKRSYRADLAHFEATGRTLQHRPPILRLILRKWPAFMLLPLLSAD